MREPPSCRREGDHPTNGRIPRTSGACRRAQDGPERVPRPTQAGHVPLRASRSAQPRTHDQAGHTARPGHVSGVQSGGTPERVRGAGCVCAPQAARGGGGQGCTRGGGPIYSRPDQEKLSGGTGVAGGSVGTHEVPAAGSSPLILRVGESACGVARVVRSWGSELGHGRPPPYPPLRAWRGPGLSGGWQAVAAGEWSRAAPTSPASAQGGCPTSGRPAGRGPYWPDRRRRSRRARRSDFDGQPPRWTMRPSVFTVRCPGAAGWPHVAHTPGRDSGMVVRPASSSAQR